jgi:hypothetical protein
MHELPGHFNENLPDHRVKLLNGLFDDKLCGGKKVRDIINDTGLFIGGCERCGEEFVYLVQKDQWVTDAQWDKIYHDWSSTLDEALKHL